MYPKSRIDIEIISSDFSSRQSRPHFVLGKFPEIFDGNVLDIGSDVGVIKENIGADRVVGVDIAPGSDYIINLDNIDRLPFDDMQFQTVLCLDVLEHLENLHLLFHEATRVSKRWILISLPNAWYSARLRIARGRGKIAHYGLSPEPTLDRHRWFFNYEEAVNFFTLSQDSGIRIKRMVAIEKPVYFAVSLARHLFWPTPVSYRNRYVHTLFCLFEKVP